MRARCSPVGMALLALVVAGLLSPRDSAAQAAAPAADSGAVGLDPAQTMHDNLARLQKAKKSVEVVLENGKSYRGLVGGVGDHAVLLTEIQGREFFDALIALDEIAALELRVRGAP